MSDVTDHSILEASPTSSRRLAGQGALLFSGFAAAQGLSFIRNALIGHALSKDNFGIAATITLILQSIEILTDLGPDRLIIQADDGEQPRFIAAAHALLVARGLLIASLLFVCGPYLAHFFNAASAAPAFQLAALAPLLKGFMHLDYRVSQRRFDNRPQMLIEVAPQAAALILVFPLLSIASDSTAVVWLAVAQAAASLILSHALATRPYMLAADKHLLARQLSFGGPILASSLPLIAVYQGDRLIIGHLSGMEALANYTAAFMLTMVPGLIAAKVGHALMLPLFSDCIRRGRLLLPKFKIASEGTVLLAAVYLAGFIICGNTIVPIVFGKQYSNLGNVTIWLAAMWSLRMIQAVPGMALMAHGKTKPFFTAGMIRALALPCVLLEALHGAPIALLAAIGFIFEATSLLYIARELEKLERGLGKTLALRTAYLAPVALVSVLASVAVPASPAATILAASVVMLGVGFSGVALMPALNVLLRRALQTRNASATA